MRALAAFVPAALLSATRGEAQRPSAAGARDVRRVIAGLPRVDFAAQCRDGACDRRAEDSVFTTLDRVIPRVVAVGATGAEARRRLGPAPTAYGPPARWRRASDGASVERWTYAVTLSGTGAYAIVFVEGRLAWRGRAQQTWLDARFERPRAGAPGDR